MIDPHEMEANQDAMRKLALRLEPDTAFAIALVARAVGTHAEAETADERVQAAIHALRLAVLVMGQDPDSDG